MGQYVHSASFYTPDSFLTDGAATDFPASNTWAYTHPFRTFKSASAVGLTTRVGYDLGSSVLPTAIFIDNINLATIKVIAASDSAFTTSVLLSNALTMAQDPVDGRYKFFSLISDLAGPTWAARQYWGLISVVTTTIDTTVTDKMVVGSLVFMSAVTTWDTNMADPRGETFEDFVRPNDDFEGGGEEPVKLGEPRALITLNASALPIDMRSTFFEMQRFGRHQPFVFYANDGSTAGAYMVRRRATSVWSKAGPNHAEPGAVILAEVN